MTSHDSAAQIEMPGLTFVLAGEGQAFPSVRQAWVDGKAFLGQTETGESEDGSLPDRTGAGGVDTFRGIATQIFEIDQRSFHEELVGSVDIAKFASQDGMEGGRKGRAEIMIGDGIVVVPVDFFSLEIELII